MDQVFCPSNELIITKLAKLKSNVTFQGLKWIGNNSLIYLPGSMTISFEFSDEKLAPIRQKAIPLPFCND